MKKVFILAALFFTAQWLSAQDTQAPLPLYISGSGKVVPFHDGDMLDVGRKFVMTAVPDKGYVFTNWQQVAVFTIIQVNYDNEGQIIGAVTSTVPSLLLPEPAKNRVLHFTMQPEQVLEENPDGSGMTLSFGWQANFVPTPQNPN